jgi:hypothetical protein
MYVQLRGFDEKKEWGKNGRLSVVNHHMCDKKEGLSWILSFQE